MKASQRVAPHERLPSHARKQAKAAPRGAQSESMAHDLEHALAAVEHPASENVPIPRHASPAPHSESELQATPAALSCELPHERRNGAHCKQQAKTRRTLRIRDG